MAIGTRGTMWAYAIGQRMDAVRMLYGQHHAGACMVQCNNTGWGFQVLFGAPMVSSNINSREVTVIGLVSCARL